MNEEAVRDRFDFLMEQECYGDATLLLRGADLSGAARADFCFGALVDLALPRAVREFGKVVTYESHADYEMAKLGMRDVSPYAALYVDEDENVHGLGDLFFLISDDNPLKKYYEELTKD